MQSMQRQHKAYATGARRFDECYDVNVNLPQNATRWPLRHLGLHLAV
jgi:hypothetical protein